MDFDSRKLAPMSNGQHKEGYYGLQKDGTFRSLIEIGMPLTGQNNLSESPLLKQLGHIRWSHISEITGIPSGKLVNENGERVYATFFYVDFEFPELNPLNSFKENDVIEVISTIRKSEPYIDGEHYLFNAKWSSEKKKLPKNIEEARRFGIPIVRMGNSFVVQFKGADWLKASFPVAQELERIKKGPPAEYLKTLTSIKNGEVFFDDSKLKDFSKGIQEISYEIVAERDVNGAGLLYFANYPLISDICERKAFEKILGHSSEASLLMAARTLQKRTSAYFGNANVRDEILASISIFENSHEKGSNNFTHELLIQTRLNRKSDGRLIYVSSAKKAIDHEREDLFKVLHGEPIPILREKKSEVEKTFDADKVYVKANPDAEIYEEDDRYFVVGKPDKEKIFLSGEEIYIFQNLTDEGRSIGALEPTIPRQKLIKLIEAGFLETTKSTDSFEGGKFFAILRRPESEHLVIQFRGGAYDVFGGVPPQEFGEITGINSHNLIMVRDISGQFYCNGLSPDLPDLDSVIKWLRGVCDGMGSFSSISCLGTSMGAYAAIVVGSKIGAKNVWAFSPQEPNGKSHISLKEAIQGSSKMTSYSVWFGSQNAEDTKTAKNLEKFTQVKLNPVQTDNHWVAVELWKKKKLPQLMERTVKAVSKRSKNNSKYQVSVDSVSEIVRNILNDQTINSQTPLNGLIDSFAFVALTSAIEESFGINISISKGTKASWQNIDEIVSFLKKSA